MQLSRVEGDYLTTIYRLENDNYEPYNLISFKNLSLILNVSVSTINATVKRLAKKELLNYYEYKGVCLTALGKKEALNIINTHRIWEYFLVNKLGLNINEVHDEANKLEHATSQKVIEAMYKYLDYPNTCPHGEIIELKCLKPQNKRKLRVIGINEEVSLIPNKYLDLLFQDLHLLNTPQTIKILKYYDNQDILVVDQAQQHFIIPQEIIDKCEVY